MIALLFHFSGKHGCFQPAVILNTAFSITDLSKYINGGDPQTAGGVTTYPTQAFALYTVTAGSSSGL